MRKRIIMSSRSPEKALTDFDEVVLGYTPEQAVEEAGRCSRCTDALCAKGCPAGNYIPDFIHAVAESDFPKAYHILKATNPFMEVTGRICPSCSQCEAECHPGDGEEPINIRALERFVADWHRRSGGKENHTLPKRNGMRVAIVGGGPAGMTAALSLAESGFQVVLYEMADHLGGTLTAAAPNFVLPHVLFPRLVENLKESGVEIRLNTRVGADPTIGELKKQFDAVLLTTGSGRPVEVLYTGYDMKGVYPYHRYLNAEVKSGRNVIVSGKGRVAVYAARYARRCGAENVMLLYSSKNAESMVTQEEVEMAKTEGIRILQDTRLSAFLGENGVLTGAVLLRNGEEIRVDADLAVVAMDSTMPHCYGMETGSDNRILIDSGYHTSEPRIYAAGDMIGGPSTFIEAASAGKNAAASVFADLIETI